MINNDFFKKISKFFSEIRIKINAQKNITAIILSQIYIVFLTLCVTYFTFKLLTNYESSTTILIKDNITIFAVSALLIFIISEFLYLITFMLYVPLFVVYPLITIAAVVNVIKIQFRSEPLVFTDLLILKESANIAGNYPLDFTKYLPFLIPVFILLLILPLFVKRIKLNWIKRAVCGLSALGLTFVFFYSTVIPETTFIEENMQLSVWNLTTEYKNNGFILEFFKSYKRSLIFAPKDYNKSKVQEYADELGYLDTRVSLDDITIPPEELPNVIIIMNEAYWDADNMTGIMLNQDPLESVRSILAKSGNTSMLSPQYGGGTSNVEYEVLTGKNILYYPANAMIYQMFITQKQWSLAWYFKDLDYATTAIHPYKDWFWKRNLVYPLLGFDNFYHETTMNYIDRRSIYISDKAVSDEVINRYEMFSNDGNKPIFTFAVTMQNHGDYYGTRYKDEEKQISLVREIDPQTDGMIESFLEGLRYASEAFVYLTEYFANVERPTYIIMFGDHAPHFANNKLFYALDEEANLYFEDIYNTNITPLLIWTNQDTPEINEKIKNINTISSFMLTEEIFNLTNLPKPGYIQMLTKIKEQTKGFTDKYTLNETGDLIGRNPEFAEDSETPEMLKIKEIFEKLKIVQYDATLGKNYVIDEFN